MFLHLGRNTIVNTKDILGIFDIETASTSKITCEYLKETPQKEIISVTDELPKSFIVCGKSLNHKNKDNNEIEVYISQISSATLKKRLESKSTGELLHDKNIFG